MKKPNKHLTRFVAGTTMIGMVAPSCEVLSHGDILLSEKLPAKGIYAIELDISKEELDYLRFIQKLSDDIIRYPIVAREFVHNPQLFLEKYGYNKPIHLDEYNLQLILALGDEDINKAINVGDMGLVLRLLKDKNLLTDLAKTSSYINIPEEQLKETLTLMGVDVQDMECYSCGPGVCAFPVLVAAVYIAAVVSLIFGGVVNWSSIETLRASNTVDLLDQKTPLKIWALKGKPNDTYIALDHYIEEQINDIIDIVRSYNISFDEKKMREFLKLNILM